MTEESKGVETVDEKSCESTEVIDKQSKIKGEEKHEKSSLTSEAKEEPAELRDSQSTVSASTCDNSLPQGAGCSEGEDSKTETGIDPLDPAACDYVSEPRTQFVSAWEPDTDAQSPQLWTKQRIEKEWRKFNIDLAPRVCANSR